MASPLVLTHQDYTVGWLSALSIEAAAGKAMLDDTHVALRQPEHDYNKYTLGRIGPYNVVLTCLPAGMPGTAAAAMVATQMLRTCTQIKLCLMVGVGGGVPSAEHDIRLGVLLSGASNIPPSFLRSALGELQSRHEMERSRFSSYLTDVLKRHPNMATTFAYPGNGHDLLYESEYDHPEGQHDCSHCEKKHLVSRLPRDSQDCMVHYGLIASGNRVMRHGATREKLWKEVGVICFEMEAAGLVHDFPCLVIRGICDYSDSHKNKKWQRYAALTAACYAKEFLLEVDVAQVQKERTMVETAMLPDPGMFINRAQSHTSSAPNPSWVRSSEDWTRHAKLLQPELHPEAGLDESHASPNQLLSSRTQTVASDTSQFHHEGVKDLSDTIMPESNLLVVTKKDFEEALTQFKSSISQHQYTSFRSTTFRGVRGTLMRIQKQQAKRSGCMDLTRVNGFLEGLAVIERNMQSTEKTEFVAYVLGTMRTSLQATSNLPNVFDIPVKSYQRMGESIMFSEAGTSWLSVNPQTDLVLMRICTAILQMQLLVLRALSVPGPLLGKTFSSIWSTRLPQWEQSFQELQGYKDLAENRESASAVLVHEQRRILNLKRQQAETIETKDQWNRIQQWLAGVDSLQTHGDIRKTRQETPKSGAWLLEHSKYVSWRLDDVPQVPILWLSGMLGAGKTVLMSGVVDHCQQDENVSTAFFYCHYDDPQRTGFMSILRAILAQLLTIDHVLLPWCYEQYTSSNQLSLTNEKLCTDMLTAVLMSNNRTFLVLDGIDECEQKDRKLLLNFFTGAVAACESYDPGKLRVMYASRDEHDIRKALQASSEISCSPTDNEGDMRRFLKIWCRKIQDKFEEIDQAEIDYLSESTFHRANGMFLFARLVIENLHDQISLEALQEQVLPNHFPDGLDAAYERILNRISNGSDSSKVAHAKKILVGWPALGGL